MVKGGAFLVVLVVGLAPILLIGLIVTETGLGLVALRPPILWTDQFGASSGDNSASLVSADSTGVYVQGYLNLSNVYAGFLTTGSLFLSKHDPAGEAVWMRNVGNTSYNINGISLATDGVYLIGSTFGAEQGCIVWNYSLSGDLVWSRRLGGIQDCYPGAISVAKNSLYVAGRSSLGAFDLEGNAIWTSQFSSQSSPRGAYADASGVYLVGSINGARLAKFDLNGNPAWTASFSGGSSVTGDSTGVYISGVMGASASSTSIGFLRKYSFDGTLLWEATFEPPDYSGILDSSVSAGGSGVYTSVATAAGHDFFLRYDSNGRQIWSFQMQPSSYSDDKIFAEAYRVAAGAGGVYYAGSSVEDAMIGEVSSSSSLIFFGLNPPLSFGVVGLLAGIGVASVLLMRRRWKRKHRPCSANMLRFKEVGKGTDPRT